MRLNVSGGCDCEFCSATGTGTVSLPGCCPCPRGTGTEICTECWRITIAGVVADDPESVFCVCPDFNGTYVLFDDDPCSIYDFPNDCTWIRIMGDSGFRPLPPPFFCALPPSPCAQGPGKTAPGDVWSISLSVSRIPANNGFPEQCKWSVVITQTGLGAPFALASYQVDDCNYNCKGKLTLNKLFDPPGFCIWPSTITIEPSKVCFPTGTGTFGTGTRDCENFTCIWEFQDIGGGQWVVIFDGCPNSSNPDCGCNIIPPFNEGLVFGDQHWLPCTTVDFPTCGQLECVWEFDGSVWNIIYDGCYFVGSCICGAPPAIPSPTAGDQATTPCIGA